MSWSDAQFAIDEAGKGLLNSFKKCVDDMKHYVDNRFGGINKPYESGYVIKTDEVAVNEILGVLDEDFLRKHSVIYFFTSEEDYSTYTPPTSSKAYYHGRICISASELLAILASNPSDKVEFYFNDLERNTASYYINLKVSNGSFVLAALSFSGSYIKMVAM